MGNFYKKMDELHNSYGNGLVNYGRIPTASQRGLVGGMQLTEQSQSKVYIVNPGIKEWRNLENIGFLCGQAPNVPPVLIRWDDELCEFYDLDKPEIIINLFQLGASIQKNHEEIKERFPGQFTNTLSDLIFSSWNELIYFVLKDINMVVDTLLEKAHKGDINYEEVRKETLQYLADLSFRPPGDNCLISGKLKRTLPGLSEIVYREMVSDDVYAPTVSLAKPKTVSRYGYIKEHHDFYQIISAVDPGRGTNIPKHAVVSVTENVDIDTHADDLREEYFSIRKPKEMERSLEDIKPQDIVGIGTHILLIITEEFSETQIPHQVIIEYTDVLLGKNDLKLWYRVPTDKINLK